VKGKLVADMMWTKVKHAISALFGAITLICLFPLICVSGLLFGDRRWRYTLPVIIFCVLLTTVIGIIPVLCIALIILFTIPTSLLAIFLYNIYQQPPNEYLEHSTKEFEAVFTYTISNRPPKPEEECACVLTEVKS
jgi:hypothetical protein